MTYAPCGYCRTEKPAPSGNCYNCGAQLLEVVGWVRGQPITALDEYPSVSNIVYLFTPLFILAMYLLGYFKGLT